MNSSYEEEARIGAVYAKRDKSGMKSLYAWYRPEVREQDAEREKIYASMLFNAIGSDLSGLSVLDVGCGAGGFLRMLVDWGATPALLTGTEYLQDRLELAAMRSAPGIGWHLGDLRFAKDAGYDLVTANTVFSSVLEKGARAGLAGEMWRILKPGGYLMVFDFRYDNPANNDVRKVTRRELDEYWQLGDQQRYQTLLLAPPLARLVAPYSMRFARMLGSVSFLRSHFVYMVRKPTSAS